MGVERNYNAAVDFIDRNVKEGRGNKAAFIDATRSISYAELCNAVSRVGPVLQRLGVERENRIALIVHDSIEFPILFWGAIRAGVVPVLLNTLLTNDQYRFLLDDSRAKVAFVSAPILAKLQEAAKGLASLKHIVAVGDGASALPQFEALLAGQREPAPPADTCCDEVAYWLYSSGTTGMPKGVMHVHSTPTLFCGPVGHGRIGMREDDVVFSSAKLFFAYGIGTSICTLGVGATSVLFPDWPTPKAVFEVMHRYQPTMLFAVPTLYASMLADPDCSPDRGSQRLRLCFSAGEPLPPHIGEGWKQRYGIDICNGVGSSEMGHLFLTNLPDAVEYGTSGIPVDGYEVRLVDETGRDVADGEIGELLVRCETAALGYWNQRERSRRVFQGEWTRTGDKYVRRPDGVYSYCGRTDDMFKVSGIWVSPFEVEAALASHPDVLEAAVVPAEDDKGLIKPKAYVVLKGTPGEGAGRTLYEGLKVHVKQTVGPWKYPRWIEFVDTLPKTATGKIQRYMLRELASRQAEDTGNGS
ncbi:MAG: benzoate-CoA ligase family protein [Hyphomicrobiales bacterium]|nr:benzoate-CoA ligase family protein [Hyphomicrobiales bacterium]